MIKIQNIYYMLAYAFHVLKDDCYKNITTEDFEYVEDLLAAILAKGIANQIKRGLGREYISCEDTLNSPHGKINISSSLKEQTILKRQLVCEFDEFSGNTYVNKILKTSALILIRSNEVKPKQKHTLRRLMHYFHNIDTVKSRNIKWAGIIYHRNNSTYKMLINICYLVIEAMLPSAHEGSKRLRHFKDEHMHRLFEKFVLEYYKKHHPDYKVFASQIDWNIDDGFINFLPVMKSDIMLEYNGKTLIIDTKYYSHILQTNYLYNNRTIHSANLYQIFTYVKNKDIYHSGNVRGILLYAKTDEEIVPDNNYFIDGNKISVKTLDLDKDFTHIRKQLDVIVEEWLK